MIRTVAALATLATLAMLAGCTGKLPWTADTVPMVAKRCGLDGLTVESRGVALGGLSEVGKEPPGARKMSCLRRHIRVPAGFFVLYG